MESKHMDMILKQNFVVNKADPLQLNKHMFGRATIMNDEPTLKSFEG